MYSMKEYSRNANYVIREVHGSFFLIDITDNYSNGKCRMLELNEVGAFIWNNLEKPSNAKCITNKLLAIVIGDVNHDEVYNDVKDCLDSFVDMGIAFVEN